VAALLTWIVVLPFLGFLANGLLGNRLGRGFVSVVGCGLPFASFALAIACFRALADGGYAPLVHTAYTWADIGGQTFEHDLDQRLGLGPRDQHRGRDREIEAEELAPSGEVGDRLAVATALGEREERVAALARQRIGRVRDEPRPVHAERVRKQNVGIGRDEARQGDRAPDREAVLRHRSAWTANSRSLWP
jgi:hypothetical protein